MELFNKYQSRAFQFALELMERLSARGQIGRSELTGLAGRYGLDYADQVVTPLTRTGLLETDGQSWRLGPGILWNSLPPSSAELDYLQYILTLPEAALFLPADTKYKLEASGGDPSMLLELQRLSPRGESPPDNPGPEAFRTLLQAIRHSQLIRYTYRTRDDHTPRVAVAMPWKLEYSAYDRRWWVILYHKDETRTIKARLDNLSNIQPAGRANISPQEVERAMERLLAPEPVTLRIENIHGLLERCFLVFENQLFLETKQESEHQFRLSFQYYRFDHSEILRRLLYLGPNVTLLGPESLRRDLMQKVDEALALPR